MCLPCQPIPAASPSGFSITGAVSTKTLSSISSPSCRFRDQPACQRLERLLHHVVIVAPLRIDRNPRLFGVAFERQAGRLPVHRTCRARSRSAPRPHALRPAALAYLTIEHKGPIPAEFPQGDRQSHLWLRRLPRGVPVEQVRRPRRRPQGLFHARNLVAPALAELLALDDASFRA